MKAKVLNRRYGLHRTSAPARASSQRLLSKREQGMHRRQVASEMDMRRLVEFPISDSGEVILVEVDGLGGDQAADGTHGEYSPATRGMPGDHEHIVERAAKTLEAAVASVRPAAECLLASLTDLQHPPDELTVEFSVALSAEAGVVIATLGSTANFKICMTWQRPTPAGTPRSTA